MLRDVTFTLISSQPLLGPMVLTNPIPALFTALLGAGFSGVAPKSPLWKLPGCIRPLGQPGELTADGAPSCSFQQLLSCGLGSTADSAFSGDRLLTAHACVLTLLPILHFSPWGLLGVQVLLTAGSVGPPRWVLAPCFSLAPSSPWCAVVHSLGRGPHGLHENFIF